MREWWLILREWWLNFSVDGALQWYWWRFRTLCWLRGHDMEEYHAWEEIFHNYSDCWCSCSRCDYGYQLHQEARMNADEVSAVTEIEHAMRQLGNPKLPLKIRMHPADLELCTERYGMPADVAFPSPVRFIGVPVEADDSLDRGKPEADYY